MKITAKNSKKISTKQKIFPLPLGGAANLRNYSNS